MKDKLWFQAGLVALFAVLGFLVYYIPLILMNGFLLGTVQPKVALRIVNVSLIAAPLLCGAGIAAVLRKRPFFVSAFPFLIVCAATTFVAVCVPHPAGICCWHEFDPFTCWEGATVCILLSLFAGWLTKTIINKTGANKSVDHISGSR